MVDRADRGIGAGLERWIRGHHRRRLRRLGHRTVFEGVAGSALWAGTGAAPRAGNAIEVLVDGERARPRSSTNSGARSPKNNCINNGPDTP
jgi:hypothetical protein